MVLFKTAKCGWGVKTAVDLPPNTYLMQYVGELVTEEVAVERADEYEKMTPPINYIWTQDGACTHIIAEVHRTLRFFMIYGPVAAPALDADKGHTVYSIDATRYGSLGRFVNHSCEPNLFSAQVLLEQRCETYPVIAFFTGDQIIKAGTELSIDYVRGIGS